MGEVSPRHDHGAAASGRNQGVPPDGQLPGLTNLALVSRLHDPHGGTIARVGSVVEHETRAALCTHRIANSNLWAMQAESDVAAAASTFETNADWRWG